MAEQPAPRPAEGLAKAITSLAMPGGSGSEESIGRGRMIAVGAILVGVVGALGVGMRPVWRQMFAENASRQAAAAAAARSANLNARLDDAKLQAMLQRLEYLQGRHRQRHPMWYGETR